MRLAGLRISEEGAPGGAEEGRGRWRGGGESLQGHDSLMSVILHVRRILGVDQVRE